MSPPRQQLFWQSPKGMPQSVDPLAATDTRAENGCPGVPIEFPTFDSRIKHARLWRIRFKAAAAAAARTTQQHGAFGMWFSPFFDFPPRLWGKG
jgi:hypothetical protein